VILGTAGHIDHGKTALVLALTGVDTDRLPEEKRRGITIALGFAPLRLEGIGTIGVVDVPGHEAFVRTMLAGATGVDIALLVVAADEGVMPQTREHLAILGLLGVKGGIVALTKRDLVDETMLALVEEDVRAVLAGTPLEAAPIISVSAKSGEGMDALRASIAAAARALPARQAEDLFRLPVDRVFSVAGAGTVVTGTAWSGVVDRDRTLRMLPLDRTVRVRSVETHGANVARATAGGRVALALSGVDRDEVSRDAVLVGVDDGWATSGVLRADVALLPDAPTLGPRRWVRFHLGTAEVGARIVAKGGVAPGSLRAARLILDLPVTARAGDRFVLRAGSPVTTIGGGTITDPQPPSRRAKPWPSPGAAEQDRIDWMLKEAGASGLAIASLPVRLGVRPATVERMVKDLPKVIRLGDRLVRTSVLDGLRERLLAAVDAAHASSPLAPGLDRQTARSALTSNTALADEVIRRAERAGLVVVEGAAIRRPGFSAGSGAGATDARARLLETLRAAGPEPPSVAELITQFGAEVPALLKLLEKDRLAYPVALDRWFSHDGLVTLLGRLRAHVKPGRSYSPSELRDPLGITRKWLIPFLEWCDRRRISLRSGDGRTFGVIPEEP
jgi:selenocysteine-specific elongation factor